MIKNIFKSFVLLSLFSFVLSFSLVATHYDTLGVPRTATEREITVSYRTLAKRYHPDQNPGDAQAAAMMSEINVAKSVLLDPAQRKNYDLTLSDGISAPPVTQQQITVPQISSAPPPSPQPTSQALVPYTPPTATQRSIAATGQIAQTGVQTATAVLGKETRGTQAAGVAVTGAQRVGTTGMQAAQELRQIDTGLRPGETQAERAARVSQAGAQAVTPAIKEAGKAAVEIAAIFRKPTQPMQQPLDLMKIAKEEINYGDTVELYFDLWKKRGKSSYLDSSGGVLGINQIPAASSKWILINPYQTPKKALRSGDVVILYNPETSSYMKIGNKKEITAEQLKVKPTADGFKWHIFDLEQIDPKILTQTGKDFLKGTIKGMPIGNPISDGSKIAIGNFSVTSKANNEHRWLRLPFVSIFKSKTPKSRPELQNKIGSQEQLVIEKVSAPTPLITEYPQKEITVETETETLMIEAKPEVTLPKLLPEPPTMEDAASSSEVALDEANKDFAALKRLGKDELEILEQEYVVAALESKVAHEKRLYFGTRVINYMERCQEIITAQSADIAAKLTELFNQENANLKTIAQGLKLADLEKEKNQNEKAAKLQQLRIDLGLAPKTLPREPAARPGPPVPPRDATEAKEPVSAEMSVPTDVIPTPPPPPPAPPAPAMPGLKPATGERAGFLADIQKGTTLKKVGERKEPEASVKTQPKKGDLMAEIRARRTEGDKPVAGLKKVEERKVTPAPEPKEKTLQEILTAGMAKRRVDIADENDDDDEEWED